MGIFERIRSAVGGAIPVENDLDMDDENRVKNVPASEDAGDAVSESEAQGKVDDHEDKGNPHPNSASTNHNNSAHSVNYATESEAADAAPVQSVNGDTGAVEVETDIPSSTGVGNSSGGYSTLISETSGSLSGSEEFKPTFDEDAIDGVKFSLDDSFSDVELDVTVNGDEVVSGERGDETINFDIRFADELTAKLDNTGSGTRDYTFELSAHFVPVGSHDHPI